MKNLFGGEGLSTPARQALDMMILKDIAESGKDAEKTENKVTLTLEGGGMKLDLGEYDSIDDINFTKILREDVPEEISRHKAPYIRCWSPEEGVTQVDFGSYTFFFYVYN